MTDSHSNRRQFLNRSAAGGGLLALPHFASLARGSEAASAKAPQRLVVIHAHLGFYPHEFYPQTTGTDFEAPRLLQPLEPFRGNYTIFNGLDHPDISGGHAVTSTLLTGENYKLRPSKRHGISLDQFIANKIGGETRFDKFVINLPGGGVSTTVSFDTNGTPFADIIGSPQDLYNRLFVTDAGEQKRLQQTIESNRSILDGLRADLAQFERQLGSGDRDRLEHYLTAIRELEAQMAKQVKWSGIDKPAPPDGYTLPAKKMAGRATHQLWEPILDLAALALQTDSTRVMTIAISGGTPTLAGTKLSTSYHQLSHHGKQADKIAELLKIEDEHMKQVARFLDRLATTTDADGRPLLDTTTVMLSSGIGNAHSHSNQHLPVMVFGGGYRHRGYVDLRDQDIPLCNLFVNFARRMPIRPGKIDRGTGIGAGDIGDRGTGHVDRRAGGWEELESVAGILEFITVRPCGRRDDD